MGVPKQMSMVAASRTGDKGIQSHRSRESYIMTDTLKAPFPWPGGKSDIAPQVWARFGVVENYVEPMCGTAAMLLARPGGAHGTETVNDVDGLLINTYRSILFAADETAEWCDWPVSEADLTSRHLHLKAAREELTARLFADPLWCDPMLGGWWLWGAASWIGDGWCVADGPWINVEGRLVDRRTLPKEEQVEGVGKRIPHVAASNATRDRHIGGQAARARDGVPRKMPVLDNERYIPGMANSALSQYFARLSDRLRRVRFLCGDWRRACKDSVTVNHGLSAVFLDPPYPQAEHDMGYHEEQAGDVWYQAAQWAVERGDDPRLRICIAGYTSNATDALFPASWERVRWEARGGYANQKKDGRGRENAKRETLWFSPSCLDVAAEARAAFDKPITVRESDYTGTMFEEDV